MKRQTFITPLSILSMLLACLPGHISAQTKKENLPVLHFESRTFIEDIPYGRPFIIITPKVFDGRASNICGVSIFELKKNQSCPTWGTGVPVANAYHWIQGTDNATTSFELVIKEPLKFNTDYCFQFTFLQEVAYRDDQSLAQSLQARMGSFYKRKGYISNFDADTILVNVEQELIQRDLLTNISIDATRRIRIKPATNVFRFPISTSKGWVTADDFGELARISYLLELEKESLQFTRRNLALEKRKYSDILDLLDKCDKKKASAEVVKKARSFLVNLNTVAISAPELQEILRMPCVDSVGGSRTVLLGMALSYDNLTASENTIKAYELDIAHFEAKFGALSELVRTGIKSVGFISTENNVEISDRTAIDKVRFGTAFGASSARLNAFSGGDKQWSAFGYFALKYYLRPVDKGLKEPYLNRHWFWGKSAIFVGLKAVGDLEYKGSTLNNLFGTKPVLGFSYDLNRFVSLDLGTVLFSQNSVRPLLNDKKQFRAAFTIGLSFDPDLINRMKALFSNEKYKIP